MTSQLVISFVTPHKTANGGVAVMIQPKSTGAKGTLVASDANNAAGGWSLEGEDNGQIRAYLRNSGGTPVILTSSTWASPAGTAKHVAFTWGAAGLKLYVDGSVVDSDAETDGATGTSNATVGLWHSAATSPYYGLMSKLVLFATQPSDAAVATIALPLNALKANDDNFGDVNVYSVNTFDALADDHYQGAKASATVAISAQGSKGTWSVNAGKDLVYTCPSGATPGIRQRWPLHAFRRRGGPDCECDRGRPGSWRQRCDHPGHRQSRSDLRH